MSPDSRADTWKEGLHTLLSECARKDTLAFESLLSKTYRPLHRVLCCRSYYLLEEEVESILNQVYGDIWLKAHSYRGRSEHTKNKDEIAWRWIRKLATNSLYDYFRLIRKLESEITEADLDTRENEDESNSVSKFEKQTQSLWGGEPIPLEDKVALNELWEKFLAILSREEQFLFQRLAEGYRENEIAQFFRVTPPAITQRKQSLRAKWSAFLKKELLVS